jgi:hypothetical protein
VTAIEMGVRLFNPRIASLLFGKEVFETLMNAGQYGKPHLSVYIHGADLTLFPTRKGSTAKAAQKNATLRVSRTSKLKKLNHKPGTSFRLSNGNLKCALGQGDNPLPSMDLLKLHIRIL